MPACVCSRAQIFTILMLCMVGFSQVGCSTNPATGKRQFNILSEAEEIKIGSDGAPQFVKTYGGRVSDQRILNYVTSLGKKLAASSERPDLPWSFEVVDSGILNAFALPGGKVFISRGLMIRMTNEAQLAAVLGHEIGHVTAQHIGQQMSRQKLIVAGAGVLQGAAGATVGESWSKWAGVIGGAGGKLYLLKFGRDQESQSDSLGLRYMTKHGYDPQGMIQLMEILAAAGGGGMEILQTHPLSETRIQRIKSEIRERYAHTQGSNQFSLHADRFQPILAALKRLPRPRHPTQQQ